jgi:small subunit ribosomal protein S19
MSRSTKKGPYIDEKLIKKVQKARAENNKQPIKTWARAAVITPEMVGATFAVHNGKNFNNVFITESMVSHRLGEFSITRKFTGHSKKGKIAKATGTTGRIIEE